MMELGRGGGGGAQGGGVHFGVAGCTLVVRNSLFSLRPQAGIPKLSQSSYAEGVIQIATLR